MSEYNKLGIIWGDQITLNMFLDFFKTIYSKKAHLDIASYTLLHSVEVAESILSSIPDSVSSSIHLVTIKSSKVFNIQNLVVQKTMELLPVVVRIPSNCPESIVILKGGEIISPVTERWAANLSRMAQVGVGNN